MLGTRSRDGHENLALFSQVFHLGANPFLVGVLFRPDVVERHTLKNVRETGVFTLSATTEALVPAAHQTSAKYAAEVSEFEATGLTPYYHEDFQAPAVAESPLRMGLNVVEHHPITANNTLLYVGEVLWLQYAGTVAEDGYWNAADQKLVACGGLDGYYGLEWLGRQGYAEPK
jgi:flavin reductase (DIM6/NTAB) family NADH-FMN oxidoreductase RutF